MKVHKKTKKYQGVYIVIPAYNEEVTLREVIRGVSRYIPRNRIILVNDGSSDATNHIGCEEDVIVIRHKLNRGQGAALATGIKASLRLGARAVVTFDADNQHNPDDIPIILEPVLSGKVDVVLGSRFLNDDSRIPRFRRTVLKIGVWITRVFFRMKVTDIHNGFRALNTSAAQRIQLRQDNMVHASEFLDEIRKNNLSYVECPVRISYSTYSQKKGQKNHDAFKLALRIFLYKVLFS